MSNEVKQEADRREVLKVINTQVVASHNLNSDPHCFVINQNSLAAALLDLLATVRREEREAALNESAESVINEAGKVGQLMDLASASARKEERSAIKSMLEDYFKHFFCTCHGSTRTGGHFASCPTTIRDEVLGRLSALEASANSEKGREGNG